MMRKGEKCCCFFREFPRGKQFCSRQKSYDDFSQFYILLLYIVDDCTSTNYKNDSRLTLSICIFGERGGKMVRKRFCWLLERSREKMLRIQKLMTTHEKNEERDLGGIINVEECMMKKKKERKKKGISFTFSSFSYFCICKYDSCL